MSTPWMRCEKLQRRGDKGRWSRTAGIATVGLATSLLAAGSAGAAVPTTATAPYEAAYQDFFVVQGTLSCESDATTGSLAGQGQLNADDGSVDLGPQGRCQAGIATTGIRVPPNRDWGPGNSVHVSVSATFHIDSAEIDFPAGTTGDAWVLPCLELSGPNGSSRSCNWYPNPNNPPNGLQFSSCNRLLDPQAPAHLSATNETWSWQLYDGFPQGVYAARAYIEVHAHTERNLCSTGTPSTNTLVGRVQAKAIGAVTSITVNTSA